MSSNTQAYTLIETSAALEDFHRQNKNVSRLCFDTEFVGEKRFQTLLCLVQVISEQGTYLIDPLKVKDLGPLLDLLADPAIQKVTHAGENDYRLLHTQYGLIPQNTFDTQVAAGFLGYKYPISFARLVESELNVRLGKGYAVTDWESRPFSPQQLSYAIDDVRYLPELVERLTRKLEKQGRLHWAREEFAEMERPEYYAKDPNREALNSKLIRNLKTKEQLFLVRLLAWRTEEARRLDYSREMILPSRLISQIVRSIRSGVNALRGNRRLPDKLVQKHGARFEEMYKAPPTAEEKAILAQIPQDHGEDQEQDLVVEMLHLLVRYKCLQEQISPAIVLPRNVLKELKGEDPESYHPSLDGGWREEFLGEGLTRWLRERHQLDIEFDHDRFELKLKD